MAITFLDGSVPHLSATWKLGTGLTIDYDQEGIPILSAEADTGEPTAGWIEIGDDDTAPTLATRLLFDGAVVSVDGGVATIDMDSRYLQLGASIPWSSITNRPTTLNGYGITDAAPAVHQHDAAAITSGVLSVARGGFGRSFGGLGPRLPYWNGSVFTDVALTTGSGQRAVMVNSDGNLAVGIISGTVSAELAAAGQLLQATGSDPASWGWGPRIPTVPGSEAQVLMADPDATLQSGINTIKWQRIRWQDLDPVGIPSFVPTSRQITAGTGLSGGGDLTADRTLSIDRTEVDQWYAARSHTHDLDGLSGTLGPDKGGFGRSFTGLGARLPYWNGSAFTDVTLNPGSGQRAVLVNSSGDLVIGTISGTISAADAIAGQVLQATGTGELAWGWGLKLPTVTAGSETRILAYDEAESLATGKIVVDWASAADIGAVPSTRRITAGTGLTGGGQLTADRSLAIDRAVVDTWYRPATWLPTPAEIGAAASNHNHDGVYSRVGHDHDNRYLQLSGGTLSSSLRVNPSSATDIAYEARVGSEAYVRLQILANGQIGWGPGTATRDVFLRRDGAGNLTMEGATFTLNRTGSAFNPFVEFQINGARTAYLGSGSGEFWLHGEPGVRMVVSGTEGIEVRNGPLRAQNIIAQSNITAQNGTSAPAFIGEASVVPGYAAFGLVSASYPAIRQSAGATIIEVDSVTGGVFLRSRSVNMLEVRRAAITAHSPLVCNAGLSVGGYQVAPVVWSTSEPNDADAANYPVGTLWLTGA